MRTLWIFCLSFILFAAYCQNDACPCCSADYRAFDFWIGEWEVKNADGQVLGYNTITVSQDSCVLQENWRGAGGVFTGTSLNQYDIAARQWKQLWLDNKGGRLELAGYAGEGVMILDDSEDNSRVTYNKVMWAVLEDGSIRQHWQMTRDGGQTWQTLFDGYYWRKS